MFLKKFCLVLVLLSSLLLISCNINSPSRSFGTLNLNVSFENDSRTILYNIEEADITEIRIDFNEGPVNYPSQTVSSGSTENINLYLQPGNWSVDVYGLDSANNEIAHSNAVFEIQKTEITNLAIVLSAMTTDNTEPTATGEVSVVLDWSAAGTSLLAEVDSVSAYWGASEAALTDISAQLDISNMSVGRAHYSSSPCPSGNYILKFYLMDNENTIIAAASEAVNVRDHLLSSGTILLAQDDFNLNGLNLTISLDVPVDADISFNYSNGTVFSTSQLSAGITISAVSTDSFDSYSWSLHGTDLSSTVTDSVNLPTALNVGVPSSNPFRRKKRRIIF